MTIQERMQNHESFLVADDGQFLGKLSLNKYDSDSIFNTYGSYGSAYSNTSIFNQYCNYGSPYSSLSPYNQYTSTPPNIYLKGRLYGKLTKNPYLGVSKVNPDDLVSWLQKHNLRY